MAYLTIFENMDERQLLVFTGHTTQFIIDKATRIAVRQPERVNGWCVGFPREGEPHAYIKSPDGTTWNYYEGSDVVPRASGTFPTILELFLGVSEGYINSAGVPPGISRLSRSQVF